MAYFVGIDSGGTKTECWLGDETRVLAEARTGTAKLTRVGGEVAAARLAGLLREVSAQAGVELHRVSRTCVGMAGYSIAEARELAVTVVAGMVGGEVEVCGDDEIALDAAFQGGAGILVIGGTGSVVLGRCGDGTRISAGGWGPVAGDEGSGYWIGREAVRKAFRSYDEGVETGLLEAIMEAWGARDMGEVIGMANARPGPDFAGLTHAVVRCADAGDEIAARLLTKAGNELAKQVAMVWRKMVRRGEGPMRARYTGSVVERIGRVNARLQERVAEECVGVTMGEGAVNALEGAMWRARGAMVLQRGR